jgi:hypothetical protein
MFKTNKEQTKTSMIEHGIFRLHLMNGVLVGTYTNSLIAGGIYYPEMANPICKKSITDPFTGTYHSVWFETDTEIERATLEISLTNQNIYILKWSRENDVVLFNGVAQREDDTLYGTYTSIQALPDR